MDSSIERTNENGAKRQFLLTGFTQAAGIRIYTFEGRVDASRIDYTVTVDLAVIPGFGIRIQDLPLLCRELLQQEAQSEDVTVFVLTEHQMRCHAEKPATRGAAGHKKKEAKYVASADAQTSWPPALRAERVFIERYARPSESAALGQRPLK